VRIGKSYLLLTQEGIAPGCGVATMDGTPAIHTSAKNAFGPVFEMHTSLFTMDLGARPGGGNIGFGLSFNDATKNQMMTVGIITNVATSGKGPVYLTRCDGQQHHGRHSWDNVQQFSYLDIDGSPLNDNEIKEWANHTSEDLACTYAYNRGMCRYVSTGNNDALNQIFDLNHSCTVRQNGFYLDSTTSIPNDMFIKGNYWSLVGLNDVQLNANEIVTFNTEPIKFLDAEDIVSLLTHGTHKIGNNRICIVKGKLIFLTELTGHLARLEHIIGAHKYINLNNGQLKTMDTLPTVNIGHGEHEFEPTHEFYEFLHSKKIVANPGYLKSNIMCVTVGHLIFGAVGSSVRATGTLIDIVDDKVYNKLTFEVNEIEFVAEFQNPSFITLSHPSYGLMSNTLADLEKCWLQIEEIDYTQMLQHPELKFNYSPNDNTLVSIDYNHKLRMSQLITNIISGNRVNHESSKIPHIMVETSNANSLTLNMYHKLAMEQGASEPHIMIITEGMTSIAGQVCVTENDNLRIEAKPRLIVVTASEEKSHAFRRELLVTAHKNITQRVIVKGYLNMTLSNTTNDSITYETGLIKETRDMLSLKIHDMHPSLTFEEWPRKKMTPIPTNLLWVENYPTFDPHVLAAYYVSWAKASNADGVARPLGLAYPLEAEIERTFDKQLHRGRGWWEYVDESRTILRDTHIPLLTKRSWDGMLKQLGTSKTISISQIKTLSEVNRIMAMPYPSNGYMVEPGAITICNPLVQITIPKRAGKAKELWYDHENLEEVVETTNEFQVNFKKSTQTPRYNPTTAIGMPAGMGKTTITRRKPADYVDIDDVSPFNNLPAHTRKTMMEEAVKTGNFEAINSIHRQSKVEKGKTLLCWNQETCPPYVTYLGTILPNENLDTTRNIQDETRRELAMISRKYTPTAGKISYSSNYELTELKVMQWKKQHADKLLNMEKKGPESEPPDVARARILKQINGIEALTMGTEHSMTNVHVGLSGADPYANAKYLPYVPVIDGSVPTNTEPWEAPPSLGVKDLWDNSNLTLISLLESASNETKLKTWGQPNKIEKIQKYMLTKYPAKSRPVLTKVAYATERASAIRMGRKDNYQTVKINPVSEANNMMNNCFRPGWQNVIKTKGPIIALQETTAKWLSTRPGREKIKMALELLLAEGWGDHPINVANVHAKLESLLKSKPIISWDQQEIRIIVWHAKEIAASFAPAFLEAKERLKLLLKDNIIYADGLTPDELSARCRTLKVDNTDMIYENDFTKQDKQTTHEMLDVEFQVYKSLGVDVHLADLYRLSHNNWRFKSNTLRGMSDAMRWTGQVTTALGNVIVNLMAHHELFKELGTRLRMCFVLGDDNIMLIKNRVDATKLGRRIKDKYNMLCKIDQNKEFGTFLQMVLYPTTRGHYEMGPDFVRLRHRFEVTNGVTADPASTLLERTSSYCCMLGDTISGRHVNTELSLELDLVSWYNESDCINALSIKHQMSPTAIENERNCLLKMMTRPNLTKWQADIFTVKKTRKSRSTAPTVPPRKR
jgi:hypothetical protein